MMAPMSNPTITVHGMARCDTVRKARAWLDERGVAYTFHDVKKLGVPQAALARWIAALGHASLVNRRGTTWRTLTAAEQERALADAAGAQAVLLAHSALMRRPVVQWGEDAVSVGFDAAQWNERLARHTKGGGP